MTRRFGERLAALSVEPIERGARFRRAVVSGGQDRWDVGLERFELLTGGGARPDPDQSPFAGAVLVSSAAESWLEPAAPPTPLRLEGASLVGAERQVELAGPHPLGGRTLLLLAPAGDRALALTEVEPCDGRGAEARVVADLVELARAASTRLVDGPGRAMGTFGPDGSLYLQLDEPAGRSSVAVHPVGETGPEDVPPGVLLRAPRPVVADCDR